MWECFDNCMGVLVIWLLVLTVFCIVCTVVFLLFRLCIFILICFVFTSVRTTASECKLNCSSSSCRCSSSSSSSSSTSSPPPPPPPPLLFTTRLGVTSWAFQVFLFWFVVRISAHVYESGRQIN